MIRPTMPTNAHDALREVLNDCDIDVSVTCQVADFESKPQCKEDVVAYFGTVRAFDPDNIVKVLKAKGWVYRHNAKEYGFSQWVCPNCTKRIAGGE